MSSFYKMDPAAWDFGTADLTLEQEAAYLRIVNAIHKHDQPVPNNDRVLSGMFRCSTRKARALLTALIEAGKLRIENDRITNDRAVSDLVQRGFVSVSRAESGAKGGRTRANNAAKALENNDPTQANASSRIEENRIEKNSSSSSSACARDGDEKPDNIGLIPKLTHALGFDLHGQVPKYWITPEAGMIVGRWKSDLGLTDDEIVTVAVGSAKAHRSPANGPKVLNDAMARYAAEKAAPPLKPSSPANSSHAVSRQSGHGIKAQIPEKYRQ